MNILQAYKLFIRNRRVYCSQKTIETYDCHIKIFFSFLESINDLPIQEHCFDMYPDAALVSDFIISLLEKGCKHVTIRSYVRSVKAFLRFCYEEDYCIDYLRKLKLPKDDSKLKIPLTVDEVAAIDYTFVFDTEKGLRNYCIIHLMLDCGLRSQEVIHLQVTDILPDRNLIMISVSKGCKSRMTLIPDKLLTYILKYIKKYSSCSGEVFRDLRTGQPITYNCIKQLFQDLKSDSAVPRVHAHLLRHTFATSFLIGGGNLEFLRVFLGHADYNVTQKYTSLAAECKMLGIDVYHLDPIFFTRGY